MPGLTKKNIPALFIGLLILKSLPICLSAQTEQEKKKQEQEKKPPIIIEEILVEAEVPKERPVSTVTILEATQIERIKPLDLSEAIRYAPGVTVSFGDKSVYTLKLRGVDANRIALLIDGIPSYEPYFSSFDLKTIATDGIDSLKLTKGPSSVLYGANTLGGIVNIITQRPSETPQLSFNASYGLLNTRTLGGRGSIQSYPIAFSGTVLYQDSDGFYYPDRNSGERTKRSSSEYQRFNLNGKLYVTPSRHSELLFNAGVYLSEYSMPPSLDASRPRYWRFDNWNRYTINGGGYVSLGAKSVARFRAYYVHYDNTLDMFTDPEMTQRRFESTHLNSVHGFFLLADVNTSSNNQLKFSMDYKGDQAKTQDDVGEPWQEYDQLTISLGIEDHFSLFENWQLVAGLSLDYLDKFIGENTSRLNPLLGIKYSPLSVLDLHLSFSHKSRFPSMRAMYSSSSGNPDLLSEAGTIWEFGFTYQGSFYLTGSVFLSNFKDMIDSVRLPEYDFERRYFNIGKAHINGFELQFQKSISMVNFTLNYAFLDHWNETDDLPLIAISKHNLNFDCQVFPMQHLRFGLVGLWASASHWLHSGSNEMEEVPAYFSLDSIVAYQWPQIEVFARITNIFDANIYTEPGFPWRGRYFELGIRADVFK